MSKTLKLAVAEPSELLRCGLLALLRQLPAPDLDVVEIADLARLAEQLARHRPDVVVVNPDRLGLTTPHQLRTQAGWARLRCIALQPVASDPATIAAYDDAIGLYDTAAEIRRKIVRQTDAETPCRRQEPLSVREREIVVCIVKGMATKQIAECLSISAHTVITHRRNIAAKLQIHSPAGLTIYAIVNNLVELSQIRETIGER